MNNDVKFVYAVMSAMDKNKMFDAGSLSKISVNLTDWTLKLGIAIKCLDNKQLTSVVIQDFINDNM